MLNFVSYKDDPGSSQMLCFHSVVLYCIGLGCSAILASFYFLKFFGIRYILSCLEAFGLTGRASVIYNSSIVNSGKTLLEPDVKLCEKTLALYCNLLLSFSF